MMSYSNRGPYQRRGKRKQEWIVGEWVNVGFLRLRIMGGNETHGWDLVDKTGTKRYLFVPHQGLIATP